jgi:hypothetical protein
MVGRVCPRHGQRGRPLNAIVRQLMRGVKILAIVGVTIVLAAGITFFVAELTVAYSHDPNRTAEALAVASTTHPFAGFWKRPGCTDRFGFAISPAGPSTYFVSFCGPGGCFRPGTYLPETPLVNDTQYRIIDNDSIEIDGSDGFSRFVRCERR